MNQENRKYLYRERWILVSLLLPLLGLPLLLVWRLRIWDQFIGVVLAIIFVEGLRFCWQIFSVLYNPEEDQEQEQN